MKPRPTPTDPVLGDKCFFCPNQHGHPMASGAGRCELTAYLNGTTYVNICPTCGRYEVERLRSQPLRGTGGGIRKAKVDSRYEQKDLFA